ncbi:hypothetical protein [uncultured Robinsoniella sp.]|uniref:hypothetical protein n=1 Tax=uncultured Robinsoniella sp. TaxID=904190 RepID=UPI00374EAFE6
MKDQSVLTHSKTMALCYHKTVGFVNRFWMLSGKVLFYVLLQNKKFSKTPCILKYSVLESVINKANALKETLVTET